MAANLGNSLVQRVSDAGEDSQISQRRETKTKLAARKVAEEHILGYASGTGDKDEFFDNA